ncbi:MAG TPA: MMPL family transporter [Bacteroidales bacterium]|nr:MMPL family transporter [Bacteroidales bacterium]HSA43944.1 MMPL family transporter [Bacteroidales bacterium]
MWTLLVRFILRNRLGILIGIGLVTIFMAFMAARVELSYEMARVLPQKDPTYILYEQFKKQYGEDGSVMFLGIRDPRLFELKFFNSWFDLGADLKKMEGIEEVVSVARIYELLRNDQTRKFDFKPLLSSKPGSQQELDSIRERIYRLPFYEGLLLNKATHATLMAITLDKTKLNSKSRVALIGKIREITEHFSSEQNVEVHYSGLPYIRTKISEKVQHELKIFVVLALVVASLVLFFFFRSFKAVLFPMFIVLIALTWVLGTMAIFGYKITLLTGIIPPLIIIIVVENCIFLLNKFHYEYRSHGNKVKSLARIVQRVGYATLMTNLATAAGFASFIETRNKLLVEFGVVSSINIMVVFILTLFLIPIFFSYLSPPKTRHIKHLENKYTLGILEKIVYLVQYKRKVIYVVSILVTVLGIVGVTKLKTSGNVVDDVPRRDPLSMDLKFFEKEFKGILPFEIAINTGKKKGVLQLATLKRIDALQDTLAKYPEFSKALSVAEVAKFAKQAYYYGNDSMYSMPNSQERNFIFSYIPDIKTSKRTIINSFVDSSMQHTRISVQMANIGTNDIQRIRDDLRPKIDSIFPPAKYKVEMTGTSVVFLKGTRYLVNNLMTSLLLAVLTIALLLALLLSSAKMVVISLIPNLLPQLLTAALMGYLSIYIKPSTILIFSIALGISVDNSIQYLSRYRLQLHLNNWNIKESVVAALRETGYSMIYSSTVLFLGFAMFTLSSFGGTQAMGFLISFTLLIAVLANLFLLPSMLLSLDKLITTRDFDEPLLEILEEEEEEIDTGNSNEQNKLPAQ